MSGLHNNPILTPLHVRVLETLFNDSSFANLFYLTGGTALSAFYLLHRESEDLDFFTHEPLPEQLVSAMQTLLVRKVNSIKVLKRTPTFIRWEVDEVLKLDCVQDVAVRFGVPKIIDGIRVDTEENIAVNKVCTILGRLEPKDYVDLLFLIRDQGYSIDDLFKKGIQKDGGLDPFTWAQLIADCENFTILPRMRKPLKLEVLKEFYRKIRKEIIRKLKPKE